MDWFEFNLHIRNAAFTKQELFCDVRETLLRLIKPFVKIQSDKFRHWHYLLEPDLCRGRSLCEIRLRFEGEKEKLDQLKFDLVRDLADFTHKTQITMCADEPLGSHEGCHGRRGQIYRGRLSENFGNDWPIIVEILQKGSEFSLEMFDLGSKLRKSRSLQWGQWHPPQHPYYLHLLANQLFIEQ